MCADRKQILNGFAMIFAVFSMISPVVAEGTMGGVAVGEARAGVTDRAFVAAPPNWLFVMERESGSFLDCGKGVDEGLTDADGRALAPLTCGVTLTETVVVPAAATSARIIVHF